MFLVCFCNRATFPHPVDSPDYEFESLEWFLKSQYFYLEPNHLPHYWYLIGLLGIEAYGLGAHSSHAPVPSCTNAHIFINYPWILLCNLQG